MCLRLILGTLIVLWIKTWYLGGFWRYTFDGGSGKPKTQHIFSPRYQVSLPGTYCSPISSVTALVHDSNTSIFGWTLAYYYLKENKRELPQIKSNQIKIKSILHESFNHIWLFAILWYPVNLSIVILSISTIPVVSACIITIMQIA